MSERYNDNVEINVTIGGESIEMRRSNTEIFRHLGHWAIVNHIYHMREEGSIYLFEYQDMDRTPTPNYKELEQLLINKNFPIHDNIIEPHNVDVDAFTSRFIHDVETEDEDNYPDWLE